jgi:hypothetical protein
LPAEVRAQAAANIALSRRDVEAAAAASVPVIVSPPSHVYLDVPYGDPPARLPGVAHKAWSDPQTAGIWTAHRDRAARHGRLWAQEELPTSAPPRWTGSSNTQPAGVTSTVE